MAQPPKLRTADTCTNCKWVYHWLKDIGVELTTCTKYSAIVGNKFDCNTICDDWEAVEIEPVQIQVKSCY